MTKKEKQQEISRFISEMCMLGKYKASDNEEYYLHIEGLPGSACPCVLDSDGHAYEIYDLIGDKAYFMRYLTQRKLNPPWFGPIDGPSHWYIELKTKKEMMLKISIFSDEHTYEETMKGSDIDKLREYFNDLKSNSFNPHLAQIDFNHWTRSVEQNITDLDSLHMICGWFENFAQKDTSCCYDWIDNNCKIKVEQIFNNGCKT